MVLCGGAGEDGRTEAFSLRFARIIHDTVSLCFIDERGRQVVRRVVSGVCDEITRYHSFI